MAHTATMCMAVMKHCTRTLKCIPSTAITSEHTNYARQANLTNLQLMTALFLTLRWLLGTANDVHTNTTQWLLRIRLYKVFHTPGMNERHLTTMLHTVHWNNYKQDYTCRSTANTDPSISSHAQFT